jgi:hypothetical protein
MSHEHNSSPPPLTRRAARRERLRQKFAKVRETLAHLSNDVQQAHNAPSAGEEQVGERAIRGLSEEAPDGGVDTPEVKNLSHGKVEPTQRKRTTRPSTSKGKSK